MEATVSQQKDNNQHFKEEDEKVLEKSILLKKEPLVAFEAFDKFLEHKNQDSFDSKEAKSNKPSTFEFEEADCDFNFPVDIDAISVVFSEEELLVCNETDKETHETIDDLIEDICVLIATGEKMMKDPCSKIDCKFSVVSFHSHGSMSEKPRDPQFRLFLVMLLVFNVPCLFVSRGRGAIVTILSVETHISDDFFLLIEFTFSVPI